MPDAVRSPQSGVRSPGVIVRLRLARLALIQAAQIPAIVLVLVGQGPWAVWTGAVWGSVVCCAGTDSGWRWINRLLILQAICWLTLALVAGT